MHFFSLPFSPFLLFGVCFTTKKKKKTTHQTLFISVSWKKPNRGFKKEVQISKKHIR